MKIPALVLTTALLLSLSACGGSDGDDPKAKPSAPASSLVTMPAIGTIEGRLLEVGGPLGAQDALVAGKLSIAAANGAVLHADISKDGRYAIKLPPGEYTVSAKSPSYNSGRGKCSTDPVTTVIEADKTVTADVLCQRK